MLAGRRLGLPRVLEYLLLSTSGCKFSFQVAVFLQSVNELLEFMETWGFAISFLTVISHGVGQEVHARTHADVSVKSVCGTLTRHPFFVIGSLY